MSLGLPPGFLLTSDTDSGEEIPERKAIVDGLSTGIGHDREMRDNFLYTAPDNWTCDLSSQVNIDATSKDDLVNNGYSMVMRGRTRNGELKSRWDEFFNAGILHVGPIGSNSNVRVTPPNSIPKSWIPIGAELPFNGPDQHETAYGPGLEFNSIDTTGRAQQSFASGYIAGLMATLFDQTNSSLSTQTRWMNARSRLRGTTKRYAAFKDINSVDLSSRANLAPTSIAEWQSSGWSSTDSGLSFTYNVDFPDHNSSGTRIQAGSSSFDVGLKAITGNDIPGPETMSRVIARVFVKNNGSSDVVISAGLYKGGPTSGFISPGEFKEVRLECAYGDSGVGYRFRIFAGNSKDSNLDIIASDFELLGIPKPISDLEVLNENPVWTEKKGFGTLIEGASTSPNYKNIHAPLEINPVRNKDTIDFEWKNFDNSAFSEAVVKEEGAEVYSGTNTSYSTSRERQTKEISFYSRTDSGVESRKEQFATFTVPTVIPMVQDFSAAVISNPQRLLIELQTHINVSSIKVEIYRSDGVLEETIQNFTQDAISNDTGKTYSVEYTPDQFDTYSIVLAEASTETSDYKEDPNVNEISLSVEYSETILPDAPSRITVEVEDSKILVTSFREPTQTVDLYEILLSASDGKQLTREISPSQLNFPIEFNRLVNDNKYNLSFRSKIDNTYSNQEGPVPVTPVANVGTTPPNISNFLVTRNRLTIYVSKWLGGFSIKQNGPEIDTYTLEDASYVGGSAGFRIYFIDIVLNEPGSYQFEVQSALDLNGLDYIIDGGHQMKTGSVDIYENN